MIEQVLAQAKTSAMAMEALAATPARKLLSSANVSSDSLSASTPNTPSLAPRALFVEPKSEEKELKAISVWQRRQELEEQLRLLDYEEITFVMRLFMVISFEYDALTVCDKPGTVRLTDW